MGPLFFVQFLFVVQMSSSPSATLTLNSGHEMPVLGLGTWLSKPGEVKAAVKTALLAGYRHIDCAAVYENEAEVGEAFEEVFGDEANGISREDVFVTSKLWSNAHKRDAVRPALEKTLADLKLDYLDLYLVHNPFAIEKDDEGNNHAVFVSVGETWGAMEACVEAGLTRSIGVSTIPPAVHQIERHPYLVQKEHTEFVEKHGVVVTNYSPLANPGKYSDGPGRLLDNPVVVELGNTYSKTAAQILIRWGIDKGAVVIPKSVKESRIKENMDVFDFQLTADDVAAIDALDQG